MLQFNEDAKKIDRKIIYYIEMDLEICGNVYGQSPCTATGSPGTECYNTWTNCQDPDNFVLTTKNFKFFPNNIQLPIGIIGYPCIKSHPEITPFNMGVMQGVGERGSIQITMQDFEYHDRFMDPYWRTRFQPAQGTFWGRFKSRWPYYQNRKLLYFVGYVKEPFNPADLVKRTYFLTSMTGPTNKDEFIIEGKDIMSLLTDTHATAPAISFAYITEDLTAGETMIDYTFNAGYPLLPGPAYIEIGEEIIRYENNTGTQLENCTRAAWGTDERATHEENAAIQQSLWYDGDSIIDVLYDIIVNFGGIDPAYINYPDWEAERDLWLQSNDIYSILAQPKGINQIIADLSEQHAFNIWWDETQEEIKLKAISPDSLNIAPPVLNDLQNFLKDSINVKDDDSVRITQLWIYYGILDPTNNLTDPGNYKKVFINRDIDAEGPNEYNSPRIRKIFAYWIAIEQESLVITLTDRILNKTSRYTKRVTFKLDAKDLNIWTGDSLVFFSKKIQRADGSPSQWQLFVTKVTETIPASQYEFEGLGLPYISGLRYAFIMRNDAPDYENALPEDKRSGFYISDGNNPFPDGGSPYLIS